MRKERRRGLLRNSGTGKYIFIWRNFSLLPIFTGFKQIILTEIHFS